jgi:hypothetical protein
VIPFLHSEEQAARTAGESRRIPLTKLASSVTRQVLALLPPAVQCLHLAFFEHAHQVDGAQFLVEVHLRNLSLVTPAMAARITDHIWTVKELLTVVLVPRPTHT